jgi:hypothetical protein
VRTTAVRLCDLLENIPQQVLAAMREVAEDEQADQEVRDEAMTELSLLTTDLSTTDASAQPAHTTEPLQPRVFLNLALRGLRAKSQSTTGERRQSEMMLSLEVREDPAAFVDVLGPVLKLVAD